MKIIFNTDQIYQYGGIEKVLTIKANYFSGLKNCEVYIITTEQRGLRPCYKLNNNIRLLDLGVNYNRSKSYFSFENLRKSVTHFRSQRKMFKQLQPDIIISPNFNFDHYWLPFIKRKAVLIKERHASRYYEEDARKNARLIKKWVFRFDDWINGLYDFIVVLNQDEKKYVKSDNAVVITNPINIPEFQIDLTAKKVLAAGRLAPVKAFDELLKIWKEIAPEFPDWQLHIYGDDYLDTKRSLTELILDLNLENSVFLKEPVPDLRVIMKDYSIYAMTSLSECFPMVLLESLSVGLPIVSYDCPNGPRNIITNEVDGMLIKNKSKEDFASALRKLMKEVDLRKKMGNAAKMNVQRFAVGRIMKQWKQLLNLPYV